MASSRNSDDNLNAAYERYEEARKKTLGYQIDQVGRVFDGLAHEISKTRVARWLFVRLNGGSR